MKNINKFLVIALVLGFASSCNESVNPLTEDAKTGGLLNPLSTSLNYVVGSGAIYTIAFEVEQGHNATTSVDVFKSFYKVPVAWSDPEDPDHETADSIPGMWSNEVLDRTISISNNATHVNTDFSSDYAQLITGLQVDGSDLPADDGQLAIGDFWNFRFVSTVTNGTSVESFNKVKVAVSTRFAGTYTVLDSEYIRIGVPSGDWNGDLVLVESIDAKTYRQIGWAFWTDGNELFFQVDGNNDIFMPEEWNGVAQTGNGNPLITCETDPVDMSNARCDEPDHNTILLDDVEGKDIITMSFGYYTSGSGPREFYQKMEKVVN